jgi:hypothetical protein
MFRNGCEIWLYDRAGYSACNGCSCERFVAVVVVMGTGNKIQHSIAWSLERETLGGNPLRRLTTCALLGLCGRNGLHASPQRH